MIEEITEILQQIGEKAVADSVVRMVSKQTDRNSGKLVDSPCGTGFFVGPNLIATNIHCIVDTQSVSAELDSIGTTFRITGVVAFNGENDLVILKTIGEGVPLPIADSNTVQIDDPVCAVGYPGGEEAAVKHSTVHSFRQSDQRFHIRGFLGGGYSGSALLNRTGEVIGVVAAGGLSFTSSGEMPSWSHAISANTLSDLLANQTKVETLEKWKKRPQIRAYSESLEGQRAMLAGQVLSAMAHYDAALEFNPNMVEVYVNRAGIKLALLQFDAALEDCDAAIDRNPEYIEAYKNRASIKSSRGRYEEALTDWDVVIKLEPEFVEAYKDRASIKARLGRYEEAIADYDVMLEIQPESSLFYLRRAGLKTILKRYEEAFADYEAALKFKPDAPEVYFWRAKTKIYTEDYAGALEDFDKFCSLNPVQTTDLNIYSGRAAARRHLEDYEGAIKDYDMAIQIDPKDDTAYCDRALTKRSYGIAKSEQGDTEEARTLYQEAIEDYTVSIQLDPDYDRVYNSRGWAKYLLGEIETEQGNIEKGETLFKDAILDSDVTIRLKWDDPSPEPYYCTGKSKTALGEYDKAIADFNEAIRLDPTEALYYHGRAQAFEAAGQHEAAKADFEKAQELEAADKN